MPKVELSYNDDHTIDVKETTERKLTDARFSYETAEGEIVIVDVLNHIPFNFNPKQMEMLRGSTANLNLRLENIFMNYIGSLRLLVTLSSSVTVNVGGLRGYNLPNITSGDDGMCTAEALCRYYIPILGQDKIDIDTFTGVIRILGYMTFWYSENPLYSEMVYGAKHTAENYIFHGSTTVTTAGAEITNWDSHTPIGSQDGIWNCLARFENGVFTGYAISGMKDNKVVPLTEDYDEPIWLSGHWTYESTGVTYYDYTTLYWWNFGDESITNISEYINFTFLEEE